MIDCTDINKLVNSKAGKWQDFVLLSLLTQWALDCLKQIKDESRMLFPREQEQILFDKIKVQVKIVSNDLIQIAIQDLKFIGIILRDYKVGENVNFNKFLVECLLSSYKSISKEMKSVKFSKKKFDDFLQSGPQKELDEHLVSSNKAKINSYLNIRRDGDSLFKIYYTIGSLSVEKTFEVNHSGKSIEEIPSIEDKRLALQRVFHITGEYVKVTQSTPNLSSDVRQSLDEKGVPTKALSKYRDTLAHYQVFPLIKGNDNQVKELFDGYFRPIQEVIRSTIIETEGSFLQKIIEKKEKESKIDKSVVKRLIESQSRNGVQGLKECIRTMQLENKYRSMDDENKKFVDELYQTVQRMKSIDLPVDPIKSSEGKLSEKKSKPSDSIIEYISKSNLEAYNKLRDEVAPILERPAGELENPHGNVLQITQVIDRLSYKVSSSPNNNILDDFLSLPILVNIDVEIKKGNGNKEDIKSSLKKELERYFDAKSFKNNDAYSEFKDSKPENLIDLLNNNVSGENDKKKTLIDFFESIGESQNNYIPPEEYERLVNGLRINDNLKEKLFSYSVLQITQVIDRLSYKDSSSPNNNILDDFLSLPILVNIDVEIKKGTGNKEDIRSSLKKELERYFDAKSFKNNDAYIEFKDSNPENLIDLLNNNISGENANKEKLIGFFESIGKSQNNYIPPEEYERLVNGLSINDNLKEKLFSYSVGWRREKCVDLLRKNHPALKMIYDSTLLGNVIPQFKDSTPENLIDLLNNNISGENANKEKLIGFFESIVKSQNNYIAPEEYERLVKGLSINDNIKEKLFSYSVGWRREKCVNLLRKNPPALKTMYDSILLGNEIDSSVYDKLVKECRLGEEPYRAEGGVDHINQEIKELYSRRAKEEFGLLAKVNHPYAVESQIINVYSLSERANHKKKGNEKKKVGQNQNGGQKNKFEMKKLRNYLSHGDALISIKDYENIAHQLVVVKNEVEVINMLKDPTITLEKIERTMDSFQSYVGVKNIRGLLCPPGQSKKTRRSASKSCLTWDEIDKFNKGGAENRDPDNIIIDSEKFISSISSELERNEERFSKFIDLASESEVIGGHKNKVKMLTDNHRYLGHLERVGKVSSIVMHGMIGKTLVIDILREDYEDLAINVAFLSGNSVLAKVADKASMKGANYILKGKVWPGKSLRIASPVISSALSGLTAYDLVNQVKQYRNGDKDALVPIIGNSIQLATDVVVIGVEIAEAVGLFSGVSAVTGPIGMAVGVVTFVGTDIYMAVRTVEDIDEKIHLTESEKFSVGMSAFIGHRDSYIVELIDEKDGNNHAVKNAAIFLKDHPHIQRYVFPSMEAYTIYTPTGSYIIPLDAYVPMSIPYEVREIVKHTYTRKVLNNVVLLDEKRNDIKLSRTRPDNLQGIDLFCLPKGDWESVPRRGTYYCDGAIGVEYTNDRTGNYTLINLDDGNDRIHGFQGSSNIFVFGNGQKSMTGGNKDDSFIFEGNSVNEIYNSEINGYINGLGGIDTIDVGQLAPHYEGSKGVGRYQVSVNFREGILKDTSKVELGINNINVFLGRKRGVDQVVSACDTKHVDGRGGENKNYLDSIIIPKDDACPYDMKVTVNPYTKVVNNARRGNFLYSVKGEKGKEAYIELGPSSQSNNTFVFDYTLRDIAAIDKSEKHITFSFVEEFYKREKKIDVNSSFNLTVSGADKNITTYHLIDSTKIVIGQNNVYAMQQTEKPIDSLVKDYSSIADKSQMYIVVYSNNEVLTVGNSHWDVFMNDPNARTSHLVGGGGENVYVITSGHQKLTLAKLPISDVVIYDFDQEKKTDTLDLQEIKEQLKKDIDREINTEVSKIASDLLINLSLDDASKKEVVKITLKGALKNNWYKRVHIVIDNIFVIEEILDDFELTPLPLIFDNNSKTIYAINPTDVANKSKITVKKEIGDYIFGRDNDALVITNSLSSSVNENNISTIIFYDFYYGNNQDKMQWLKIEFNDKKIFLRKEIERINSAGNFSELKRKVEIDSYKAVMYAIKEQKLFEAIEGNNIGKVKELIDHGVSIRARTNDGKTPLHSAAKSGKLEVVKYLVEGKHADVNVKDNSGVTPLHSAALGGNLEVVKYLEEKHADVDANDNSGVTCLHYAASSGSLNVVKYLVEEKHADLSEEDDDKGTPLHFAALYGKLGVVKYLVEEKHADVNVRDDSGRTPLHIAASVGSLEIVKYLIDERNADVHVKDESENTPLHYAAKNGSLEMVKYIIEEKNVNVNVKSKNGQEPLHFAARDGSLEMVKYLIEEKGAGVDVRDNTNMVPLHFAARDGNLEVVRYLIEEKGADIDVRDNLGTVPLHFAAYGNSLNGVTYLVEEKGADIDVRDNFNWTTLHYAAKNGSLEVVRYLIEEKNADINVRGYSGKVPLDLAIQFNSLEVVKYLVGKGADVNLKDDSELTPLHYAAFYDNLEIVKYIIEKGAKIDLSIYGKTRLKILECEDYKHVVDSIVEKLTVRLFDAVKYDEFGDVQHLINQGVSVNAKDSSGQPLLHFAASNGKLKVVKYLVEKKDADVNVKDDYGRTCLHLAAGDGNLEVVKYLTETKGIDLNVKDLSGQTPLELALSRGHSDILKYLTMKVNGERIMHRRHIHSHHHLSHRLFTTDSSNQPEIATSNASEKSSRINDLVASIVKLQEISAPSEAASSNHPSRHERRKRHNDPSRHVDGIRMHPVRHKHRRVQKRNVKYQDSRDYIDQPEIATSSGTRPSSWINGLLDWIKEKGGGLVSSVADKFTTKESEDSKSRVIHACSVRLEKMYSATIPNIPQSRKSQGVPKGNILNTSWSDWSSNREKVTSNVTDAPEMNTTVLNNALILGDLAVRLVNGTRHKQPIHENLLSLREKSMRFVDENMIMRTIQQGKEKFGGLSTNMDV